MSVLTYAQISDLCNDFVTDVTSHNVFQGAFFNTLNQTGLRFIELYELSRWTDLEDNTYEVDTAKGSNNRIIAFTKVDVIVRNKIAADKDLFTNLRYMTATRSFKRFIKTYPLFHASKAVNTHLFRYRMFKYLDLEGMTTQEISDEMGEADNQNTLDYIAADIETP